MPQTTLHTSLDTLTDTRLARLSEWARVVLARTDLHVTVASADASFRRYFRLSASDPAQPQALQSWIAMDAPPEQEDVRPFVKVAQMLGAAGVNAPQVLAQQLDEGFLLLTDLGSQTYLTALAQGANEERLYGDAVQALVQMQIGCRSYSGQLPLYDAPLLHREMQLFPDWFMVKHLGLAIDAAVQADLQNAFDLLAESALAQPRVFVHRDYHSRNLMTAGLANPGILDFQDAVWGPITYDLVSLLRDCYIAWPLERVHGWVRDFRARLSEAGIVVPVSEPEFLRWFDLMGVQRHLKAIGIFARLWHRDGKPGYLNDIPRTLGYIRSVLPVYPELSALARLIEGQVMPAIAHRSLQPAAVQA